MLAGSGMRLNCCPTITSALSRYRSTIQSIRRTANLRTAGGREPRSKNGNWIFSVILTNTRAPSCRYMIFRHDAEKSILSATCSPRAAIGQPLRQSCLPRPFSREQKAVGLIIRVNTGRPGCMPLMFGKLLSRIANQWDLLPTGILPVRMSCLIRQPTTTTNWMTLAP